MSQVLRVKQQYSDPAYESELLAIKTNLRSRVALLAQEHAEQNIPADVVSYQMLIHSVIETEVQQALHMNESTHLPIAGMVVAKKVHDAAEAAVRQKSAAITDKKHKLSVVECELGRKKVNPWKRIFRWMVHSGLVVIAVGEGVLSYTAFRYAQFSAIAALFAAFAVIAVVGFGTFFAADYIAKARTREWKIVRFILAVCPYAGLFYYIGRLRANALNSQSYLPLQEAVGNIAKICWCDLAILSFCLFLLPLILTIWIWQSPEEKQQEFEHFDRKKQAENLASEIHELCVEKTTIQANANQQAAAALHRYEYAKAVEADLVVYARQMQQVYVELNIRHRPDKQVPAFFSNLPAFNFQLFFDPLNQSNNETVS